MFLGVRVALRLVPNRAGRTTSTFYRPDCQKRMLGNAYCAVYLWFVAGVIDLLGVHCEQRFNHPYQTAGILLLDMAL